MIVSPRSGSIDRIASAPIQMAALKVSAVDTTAAGDTFNGAFAAAFVAGKEIAACGEFASAAAALSATRRGAQAFMPTLVEVVALLDRETIVEAQ